MEGKEEALEVGRRLRENPSFWIYGTGGAAAFPLALVGDATAGLGGN